MKTRNELVSEVIALREKERLLREQIAELEYKENYEAVQKYVGRYYRDIPGINDTSVRCYFIYGIEGVHCELKTVSISYWGNNPDWFEIEYMTHFHPNKEDNYEAYDEITKGEFYTHYSEVLTRIEKALKTATPVLV